MSDTAPYVPEIWSNPQSITAYFKAARENLLNIIPPSSLTQDFTTFPSRFGNTHYVSDPDMLRHVMKTKVSEFPKSVSNELLFGPVIPNSIFIAKEDVWRDMHKIMIPVFTRANVESFEGDIIRIVDEYLNTHDLSIYSGADITPVIQDLTFRIISQILLKDDKDPDLLEIREGFEEFIDEIAKVSLWDLLTMKLEFMPNIRLFVHRKLIRSIRGTSRRLVTKRLAKPRGKRDFLELLMDAVNLRDDPTEDKINFVQDNLVTFIVAGHETTAMSLAWGLYAMGFYPEFQEKVGAEASYSFKQMANTESAVKEAMRLYPAAPILSRKTTQVCQVGALKMKANEGIIIPILSIHRHRKHWDAPDEFRPERFLNFTPKPMTYMPFGAGPRICIGASFAMMEAVIIMSKILERYEISPNGHTPKAQQTVTLRSSNGIQMNLNARMNV